MLKTRFVNLICSVLIVAAVFCLFDLAPSFSVSADTVDSVELVEEEVDPMHLKFVGRLYSIVLRKDSCDPAEKEKYARSLKGGISAAYDVLYHFYFSKDYRDLHHQGLCVAPL